MKVLGIRFCKVAHKDDAKALADTLGEKGLGLTPTDMGESDGFNGAVFPVDDAAAKGLGSWIEIWPAGEQMPEMTMLQIVVDYPDEDSERQIVALGTTDNVELSPVLTPVQLMAHQELVRRIPVPPSVVDHVVALLRASRPGEGCPTAVAEFVRWGAGLWRPPAWRFFPRRFWCAVMRMAGFPSV